MACRDNTPWVALLEHEFRRLCRTKKRAYKKASALESARLAKTNPNRLWEGLRPHVPPATTRPAQRIPTSAGPTFKLCSTPPPT